MTLLEREEQHGAPLKALFICIIVALHIYVQRCTAQADLKKLFKKKKRLRYLPMNTKYVPAHRSTAGESLDVNLSSMLVAGRSKKRENKITLVKGS